MFKKKKQQEDSNSAGNSASPSGKKVVVTEQTISYTEPNVGSPTDAVLSKGDVLAFIKEEEGWVQGKLSNGKAVWVPFFECKITDG
ncbi:hypothetical protein [Limisalsivibrio acetivorans]|uniref:hypothetical protein n=1 Tax=Limisalsivibrio acetivorans TaxID=1304888 RepID=UPI0012DDF04A|nr:hypothetical protein [Limisalsivibrio acetivorans]